MTGPVIRVMNVDDAGAFRDVFLRGLQEEQGAFLHEYDEVLAWSAERFSKWLERGNMFGAFVDNTLVGFAGINRRVGRKLQHKASVGPVYVIPEKRGLGLASQLMQALEKLARQWGVEQMTLGVNDANPVAIRLYERAGFKAWGIEKHDLKLADGSYIDNKVMAKSLV